MIKKKTKIVYEFMQFYCPTATTNFQQTLVLINPASVKFYNTSGNPLGMVIINNNFNLGSPTAPIGTNPYPTNLILDNNINEIDETIYQINLISGTSLKVIVKYYIND